MSFLSMANRVTSGAALFASITSVCYAHEIKITAQTNSASHVAAEMTRGKLNPTDSKPGDAVAVILKEDVRSNGEVIFKKGTTITGIVRNVRRADGKGKSEAQSMLDVEWRVPAAPQGRRVQSVSFALESVLQIHPVSEYPESKFSDDFTFVNAGPGASVDARPVLRSSGLMESAGNVAGATPAAASATEAEGVVNSRPNIALLSMPSVVAVDQQTSATIETALDRQTSGQLFKIGHGQLVSSGGSKEPVELYSHLSNDTVITSRSNNFEISSGAQMQMLVGVNRK